jgi:hypothetical protein
MGWHLHCRCQMVFFLCQGGWHQFLQTGALGLGLCRRRQQVNKNYCRLPNMHFKDKKDNG